MVFMPIGVLDFRKISLDNILKAESLLIRLSKMYNISIDFESFVKECEQALLLQKFSNITEYIKYIVNKYAPEIEIDNIVYNFKENESKDFDIYVGQYDINVSIFNYLNEVLWSDILKMHTSVIQQSDKKSYIEIILCFKTSDIQDFYFDSEYDEMINEFLSDLSLYLTYNKLGILILDKEPVISKEDIEIYMKMFIY